MQSLNLFILLFCIVSCGKQEFPDYSKEEDIFLISETASVAGKIRSINNNKARGSFLLKIDGDQFYSKIHLIKSTRHTRIQQYVHSGSKCPGEHSDINADGKIDYEEVLIASGNPLIPLDKKLNSIALGNEWFPEADETGSYVYSRSGSFRLIKEDLDEQNLLTLTEPFDLNNRTLIFFGSRNGPLDPIACAEL